MDRSDWHPTDEVAALARVLRLVVEHGVLEQIGTGEAARYRRAPADAESGSG